MIDKNFYLENLSAFDILIQDEDRKQAEEVIFRVYSMLQRDKIWLREVATEEEIFEEDADLLEEVEEELKELDEKYDFRFDDFYKLVQQEMKKIQSTSEMNFEIEDEFNEEEDFEDDDDDLHLEDEEDDFDEDEDEDDFYDDDEVDALSHISDEELDQITDYILDRAKTRFNYPAFLNSFPQVDEIFVEEQILFPIIAGKSHEETDSEIAEKMHSALMNSGFQAERENLQKMIATKGIELGLEIFAFGIAADSLQQGADPGEVLQQITQVLRA